MIFLCKQKIEHGNNDLEVMNYILLHIFNLSWMAQKSDELAYP